MFAGGVANQSAETKRVLIAIPCLNEEEMIGQVVQSLPTSLPGIGQVDVLVVDDGSTDNTRAIAEQNGALVISHPRNRGVGVSFQTALAHAVGNKYDAMVTIDGDGQFDSNDIPKLLQPVLDGEAELVTASRFIDKNERPENMSQIKFWGNKRVAGLVSRLTGNQLQDVSCGFRAYGREALLNLNLHGNFTYTHETIISLSFKGLKIIEKPIEVRYFKGRVSRVARSIPKYAFQSLVIMLRTYRDYHPLRFFWAIGTVLALPAIVLGAIFFGHYWVTGRFTGYLWAGFSAVFLAGVATLFFTLGLVADALGGIRRNQERLLYTLRKHL